MVVGPSSMINLITAATLSRICFGVWLWTAPCVKTDVREIEGGGKNFVECSDNKESRTHTIEFHCRNH